MPQQPPTAKPSRLATAIIVLVAVVSLGFAIYSDGPDKLVTTLKNADFKWLLLGGFCMLLYWLLESLVLHLVAKKSYPSQKFSSSFVTSMIGQLFNCITPFASGGQPIQAYYLVKRGMPVGIATSTLLAKFIVYQTVLTLYSLAVLLGSFAEFSTKIDGFGTLVLIGFAVNCAVVTLLVAVGFFPNFTRGVLVSCAKLLAKLRLIKNLPDAIVTIEVETAGFHHSFAQLRGHSSLILRMSALTAVQLTLFFSVPYCVFSALGVQNITYFEIIAASAFILMITSFVPLPGASGGAEGSFYIFFRMFFPSSGAITVAILLWRMLTFYFPIAAGTLFAKSLSEDRA